MSIRAVCVGMILAFFIAAYTYFNDHVAHQVLLIGTHFPIVIFGFLLLLVLCINPVLARLRPLRPLQPAEIVVILALGLAACGWPGSSFYRYFAPAISVPPNMIQSMTAWKAANLMSYVPGASPLLGEGHIRNFPALAAKLIEGRNQSSFSPQSRLWSTLDSGAAVLVVGIAERGHSEAGERILFVNALNAVLARPDFYQPEYFASIRLPAEAARLLPRIEAGNASRREIELFNRILLEESFPDLILPRPAGRGLYLADGDLTSPAIQGLMEGRSGTGRVGLRQIPWRTWWPTLWFWGSMVLLMGVASVCIVLVVQPQWKRELLPYPIARFVAELTRPSTPNGSPAVFRNKLFWISFACMIFIHLCNGLNRWFPTVWFINIPLFFDFSPLQKLMPVARQFDHAYMATWFPVLFPSAVALSFFLASEVSFSLGISSYLFLGFFSIMTRSGVLIKREFLEASNMGMMRFGAFLASALVLLYLGRRYYMRVFFSSLGFKRDAETPLSAVWAARIAVMCLAGMVAVLGTNGVDWPLGVMLVALIMLTYFVITRVNVETGMFFAQPMWGPLGVIVSVMGIQAIGPTAYVVMGIICAVLVLDPRECLMPYVANGLFMATPGDKKTPPTALSLLVTFVVVASFVVTVASGLYFQYNHGLDKQDTWAIQSYGPSGMPYAKLPEHITNLSAYNELSRSLTVRGLERFGLMSPDYGMLRWALAGMVLVIACNIMRVRFSWWPLHPVAFLVWGTLPGLKLGVSFLLGWLIKAAVVKMAGAKGYRTVMPLMVGLIAGEVTAALGWEIAGAIYFLVTGQTPTPYDIFPS